MTKTNPNRKGSEREPFTTIDIRAVIDATPEEQAVILAIQFLHWWLGPEKAKGLEMIEAVLINPDRPKRLKAGHTEEELAQISPRGIKRALARLRARGWVETSRAFKGKTAFTLTIPTLAFKAAYEIVALRFPDAIRAELAQRALEPSGQLGLSLGPGGPERGAELARGLLSNQTPLQTQEKDPTPDKPANGGKHPDQDRFWTAAKEAWLKRFPAHPLEWPKDAKGFNKNLTDQLTRLGADELGRRWFNCVNDPFSRPSLRNFINDTDRWIQVRTKDSGSARKFQQPETDWKPSERRAGE